MARQARNGGFTLIEVMTVVAIIGVMSALALTVIGRRTGDQRAKAAVRSVANLFLLARTEAIRTGTNHVVYLQLDPADAALVDPSGHSRGGAADRGCRCRRNFGRRRVQGLRAVRRDQFTFVGQHVRRGRVHAAPNDNPAGTFPATDPNFSCCTFTDPGGNDSRAVVFLPDGMPRAFSTGPFAMGPVGGGGGAVYVTSGTRDYAVVLSPLGSARVHSWNGGANAWTN